MKNNESLSIPVTDNKIPAFDDLSTDLQNMFIESLQRSGYDVESLGLPSPENKPAS